MTEPSKECVPLDFMDSKAASLSNPTKPKPLLKPVFFSKSTLADFTLPNCLKYSDNSFDDTVHGRLPTNTFEILEADILLLTSFK